MNSSNAVALSAPKATQVPDGRLLQFPSRAPVTDDVDWREVFAFDADLISLFSEPDAAEILPFEKGAR